jgi:hypothetical protein
MRPKKMAVGEGYTDLEQNHSTLLSHLDQFAEDTRFLESIRPELQNRYPDCWVAVYRKELVGSGTTLRDMMKQLADKGVPATRAAIDFLRKDPIALIL